MKQFMVASIFLSLFISMPVLADELYTWTDENGQTQVSKERPTWWKDEKYEHTGTEVITLPEKNSTVQTTSSSPRSGSRDGVTRVDSASDNTSKKLSNMNRSTRDWHEETETTDPTFYKHPWVYGKKWNFHRRQA